MKRLFVLLSLCLIFISSPAQIRTAVCFDGNWGKWSNSSYDVKGGYRGFMLYYESQGPWDCYFKFSIDNFHLPDAKQRRKDYKKNVWYEFSGTVEYYICDDYLTIYQLFKSYRYATFVNPRNPNGRPTKKITSKATIKIHAFKERPEVYNIFFDNVGLAISLNNLYW